MTVQLPIYNEYYVATRLLDSVAALDWPQDRLQIQVLDDSTDKTRELVAEKVAELRAQGLDIQQLTRTERTGYKAGALAAGLTHAEHPARGEYLAIFDADFMPTAEFLRRSIPFLEADKGLALVQGRWSHVNRSHSLLTRAQACFLDAHFAVEHEARQRAGHFLNFNGTAGVWRHAAIDDAGGWSHDTLTEDLDLSFRAQMHGWRFRYLHDLEVPSELPIEMRGFKQQQRRWVKGSLESARKLLGKLWTTPGLRLSTRLEGSVHLLNNLTWPLMLGAALLSLPVAFEVTAGESWWTTELDRGVLAFGLLPVLAYFLLGQIRCGRPLLASLASLPVALILGMGLIVNSSRAALAGLIGRRTPFERTPKFRIQSGADSWLGKRYGQRLDFCAVLEVLLGLECLAAALVTASARAYGFTFFVSLFATGLLWVGGASLLPGLFERGRTALRLKPKGASKSVEPLDSVQTQRVSNS